MFTVSIDIWWHLFHVNFVTFASSSIASHLCDWCVELNDTMSDHRQDNFCLKYDKPKSEYIIRETLTGVHMKRNRLMVWQG